MNELEAIAFYVQRMADLARTLPLGDAIAMLRGALCVGGEHEAIAPLRESYHRLCDSDQQLELIALGQLKLNLHGDGNGQHGGKK